MSSRVDRGVHLGSARPILACQPKRLRRPLAAGTASCAYYQAVRRLVHVWSVVAVVDELQPLITRSCCFVPKAALNCGFASQQFSSLHAVSGAHVPWMCPTSMGRLTDPKAVGPQCDELRT